MQCSPILRRPYLRPFVSVMVLTVSPSNALVGVGALESRLSKANAGCRPFRHRRAITATVAVIAVLFY